MKNKFMIRWRVILSIFFICYVVMFFFDFIFRFNFSKYTGAEGDYTEYQCFGIASQLLADHDNSVIASFVGFSIGVPLILLVFKKIR